MVDDNYIEYLREFDNRVMFNKNSERKYLGIVFKFNNYNYFGPLSSPKFHDYNKNGTIKKDTISIIRMIYEDGKLKGSIKLNNMIPVPKQCLIYYDINKDYRKNYKILIIKELYFIKKYQDQILKNAKILYTQKIKNYKFNHLKYTVDFKLLEEKCQDYCKMKDWRL
jgi:protein AbiQ